MTYLMHQRPTINEILHKLRGAIEALQAGRRKFANPAKVVGELDKLDINDSSEVWDLILDLIKEIKSDDYDGGHPPQPSTEKVIKGKGLWAFAWDSRKFGKRMYLKFALKDDVFYYVSLHESRFPPKDNGSVK